MPLMPAAKRQMLRTSLKSHRGAQAAGGRLLQRKYASRITCAALVTAIHKKKACVVRETRQRIRTAPPCVAVTREIFETLNRT